VRLRARNLLCVPSLDDRPPDEESPRHEVAPGPHQVYCAAARKGERRAAGKIVVPDDLPPGREFTVIVDWNGGQPQILSSGRGR
jgi:hypothetical protein